MFAPRHESRASAEISPDWYPTLLEAADLPLDPEQHVDGKSLLPLLRGEEDSRGPIFWHYPHYSNQGGGASASVRDGDWKLIEFYDLNPRLELYNLREDISETTDLAATETERLTVLTDQLHGWQKEVEALFPKPNRNYVQPPLGSGVDAAEV